MRKRKQPPVAVPDSTPVDPTIRALADLHLAHVSTDRPHPSWRLSNSATANVHADRSYAFELVVDGQPVHRGRYTPRQLASGICLAATHDLDSVDTFLGGFVEQMREATQARER